ncbi:MAG: tyrosine-type recombinase/integrase [Polyangia bacterium]
MSDRPVDVSPRERMWREITKDRTSDDTGDSVCYSDHGKPLHRKETAMQHRTHETANGIRITGPYQELDGRWRLRIVDGVNEQKRSYATEKEALQAKARLELTPEQRQEAYVSRIYQEGCGKRLRFRIHVFDGSTTTKPSFSTIEEAEKARQRFERELANRREASVSDLIEAYMHHHRVVKGNRPRSSTNTEERLRRFFERCPDLYLRSITPQKAEELYEVHVATPNRKTGQPLAACTQHHDLKKVRALFGWAVKRGMLLVNPFAGVELIGRPKKGKRQLTLDQAKQFFRAALTRFEQRGDKLALAAIVALTTGARASEVMNRTVGELDEGGTALVVQEREATLDEEGAELKNKKASRVLEIKQPLPAYLLALAAGKPPTALLFRNSGTKVDSARILLRRKIRKICAEEGLPLVTTHSFRGLFATMLFRKSRDTSAVAELMGHTDFGMTRQAYLAPGTYEKAQSEALADALGLKDPGAEADRILSSLDGPTLAALVERLPGKLPGLLIGSTTNRGTISFPNRSREADRHQISDGDA